MSDQNSNLISLHEASKISGYHQDYLGQLCRKGKLAGVKIGRNWSVSKSELLNFIDAVKTAEEEIAVPDIEQAFHVPVRVIRKTKDLAGFKNGIFAFSIFIFVLGVVGGMARYSGEVINAFSDFIFTNHTSTATNDQQENDEENSSAVLAAATNRSPAPINYKADEINSYVDSYLSILYANGLLKSPFGNPDASSATSPQPTPAQVPAVANLPAAVPQQIIYIPGNVVNTGNGNVSVEFSTGKLFCDTCVVNQNLSVGGTLSVAGSATFSGSIIADSFDPDFSNGSIVFQGSSGLAEDNTNFFYDDTNNILGLGTNSPSASAILDLSSTTKGLLTPRMTTVERDAIVSPVAGLTVYNTSSSKFNYYDGGSWIEVASGVISSAVSGLTAATGDASINNSANNIIWNWQLTGAESAFTFGENVASTGGSSNQYILQASTLGSSTATPLYVKNLGAANSFQVDDVASDTTPFVIDASGNVGIGTTSPNTKLDIVNASITNDTSNTMFRLQGGADGSLGPLQVFAGSHPSATGSSRYGYIGVGDNSAMRTLVLNSNGSDIFGNVAIGTSSTSQLLTLSSGSNPSIRVQNTGSTRAAALVVGTLGAAIEYSSNFNFSSRTYASTGDANGTVQMTIEQATGNVGIGTASPDARLEIGGNASASAWGVNGIALQGTAATYTDTSSSGTVTNNVVNSFGQSTLAASSATTYTNAATLYVAAAPAAGANATITNAYSIYAPAGRARFDGGVTVGTTLASAAVEVSDANYGLRVRSGNNNSHFIASFETQGATGAMYISSDRSVGINNGTTPASSSNAHLKVVSASTTWNAGLFEGASSNSAAVLVAKLGSSGTGNLFEAQNSSGTALAYFTSAGKLFVPSGSTGGSGAGLNFGTVADQHSLGWDSVYGGVTTRYASTPEFMVSTNLLYVPSASHFKWSAGSIPTGGTDLGITRAAAGVLRVTDGSTGAGKLTLGDSSAGTSSRLTLASNLSASAWGLNGIQLQAAAATYTDTSSSGTVANITANSFAAPTFAASSATTYTNASTVYIAGPPTAGTNVSMTYGYSLKVNSGLVSLGGGSLSNAANANLYWAPQDVVLGAPSGNRLAVLSNGQFLWETYYSTAFILPSSGALWFGSPGNSTGDAGFARPAAGVLRVTDASTGAGKLVVGSSSASTSAAQLYTLPTSASVIAGQFEGAASNSAAVLVAKSGSSGTGNLFEAQNSSGTRLASISSSGAVGAPSFSTYGLPSGTDGIALSNSSTVGSMSAALQWFVGGNYLGHLGVTNNEVQLNARRVFNLTTNEVTRLSVNDSNPYVTIGNGETSSSPSVGTLRGTGGSGTNIAGAALQLAGGIGTGTGVGGNIVLQYAAAGSSGSSANSLATACTISGTNGSLSCPGSGSNTERFGSGANPSDATSSVVIGKGASLTSGMYDAVVIGYNASALVQGGQVVIGSGAQANAGGGIAIGAGAKSSNRSITLGRSGNTSNWQSVIVGDEAVNTAVSDVVLLGYGVSNGSLSNAFIAGSASSSMSNVFFGEGVTDATPLAYTINGTGGSGTNIAGANLQLAAGKATGNAAGGDILFQTSDAGSSGATAQSLTTKMIVKASGNVGIGTTTTTYTVNVGGSGLSIGGTAGANPASATNMNLLSARGYGFATDGVALSAAYQPTAGIGIAVSRAAPALAVRNGAGAQAIVVESGNVGIGTSAPDGLLEIAGGLSASAWGVNGIALQGTAATYTDTSSSGTVANAVANSFGIPTFAASSATTYTAASTLYIAGPPTAGTNVTITNPAALVVASGNVGLGTTSPATNMHIYNTVAANHGLTIESNVSLSGGFFGPGIVMRRTGASQGYAVMSDGAASGSGGDNFAIAISTSPYTRLLSITPAGNVGIGTTNPVNNLQIGSVASASSATPATLSLGGTYSSSAGSNPKIKLYDDGSNYYGLGVSAGTFDFMVPLSSKYVWNINAVEKMRFDTNGNLGIGTTAPDGKLEIAGNASASAWGVNGIALQGTAATYTDTSSSGTVANAVANSFGIPTFAASSATTYTAASTVYIAGPPTAGTNVTITNPAALVVASGNVGIGTTSPSYKIDTGSSTDNARIGQVQLGSSPAFGSTYAFFGHQALDHSLSNYALLQASNGETMLNASSSRDLWIRRNNGNLARFNSAGGLQVYSGISLSSDGVGGYVPTPARAFTLSTSNAVPISASVRYDATTVDTDGLGEIDFNATIDGTSEQSGAVILAQAAGTWSSGNSPGRILFQTTPSSSSTPSTRMTIDTNGNVGIGATAPDTTLDVVSANTTTASRGNLLVRSSGSGQAADAGGHIGFGGLYITGDSSSYTGFAGISGRKENSTSANTAGYLTLETRPAGGSNTERIRIDSTGNVGIGTTVPSNKLTVYGGAADVDIKLQTANTGVLSTDGFNFGVENSSQDVYVNQRENASMHFFLNGSERVTFKPDGNVGIGTASPNSAVTIVPAVRTSGSNPFLRVQTPADTTLTASTENIGMLFGGDASAATVTRQWATGALTTQRENVFVAPTYAFVGASTLSNAATVSISGAPVAGTNATITKKSALDIASTTDAITFGLANADYTYLMHGQIGRTGVGAANPSSIVFQNDQRIKYNSGDHNFLNSAGTTQAAQIQVTNTTIGGTTDTSRGQLYVLSGSSSRVGATIEGAASNSVVVLAARLGSSGTGDLFQAQNSSGTALASITSAGYIRATSGTTSVPGIGYSSAGINQTNGGYGLGVVTASGFGVNLGYNEVSLKDTGGILVWGSSALWGNSETMRLSNPSTGVLQIGLTSGSPSSYTIQGAAGTGTNIAGGALNIAGGIATGNAAGGDIVFQTSDAGGSGAGVQSLTTKMIINELGNVGIGTTSVGAKLDVEGNVQIHLAGTQTSVALCGSHSAASGASVSDVEIVDCTGTPAADYTEMYPVIGGAEVGDIMAVGTEMVNTYDINKTSGNVDWEKVKGQVTRLVKSSSTSKQMIGIVSDNYADFSSTGYNIKQQDNPKAIALNGRVPVKVTNENGAIKPGDYLTISKTFPGYAAKAINEGEVIGRALEEFIKASDYSGTAVSSGKVMVFINITHYVPSVADMLQLSGSLQGNDEILALTQELTNLNITDASIYGNLVVKDTLYVGKRLVVKERIETAELIATTVKAKEKVCIGETCITETQLKAVLQLLDGSNAPANNSSTGTVSGASTETPIQPEEETIVEEPEAEVEALTPETQETPPAE